MALSIKLFKDTKEILDMENIWNLDFAIHFKNPNLFSRMFCGVMNFCESRGWTPLIVTFWSNNKLVGMAPLKFRKFLNTNYVQSLADDLYSDFFFFDEYREQCIDLLFEILFNRLKCMSATITLETTENLRAIKNNCPKGLKYVEKQGSGRAVIPIEKSYDEFYGSLKHKVRNNFRRAQKKIDSLGSWKVKCVEVNSESMEKILAVDQKSWKAEWRRNNSFEEDKILRVILDASHKKEGIEPIYKTEVCFLEINGTPVAYQIVQLFKETAFFIKTSFDQCFKEYSPGTFLMNLIIHETFNKKTLNKIDFITNLPFVQIWKPLCEQRMEIVIEKKSITLSIVRGFLRNMRQLRENSSFLNSPRVSALLKIVESNLPIK